MKGYEHHLHEAQLFEAYLAVRSRELPDPPVAEHLGECDHCGARYADLTEFMDAVGATAAADADALFPAERLREQRQQIARRLEHLGHSARVITFPGRASSHRANSSTPRPVRRWVAAAAAAGLIVGVGTGLFLDWETGRGAGRRLSPGIARQTVLTGGAGRIEASRIDLVRPDPSQSDEAFLSEIELAGERPRIRELIAVDALTPHVREITLR